MKGSILNLTYSSSLTNMCSKNSSFDSAVLQIAYAGLNRNKNSISKETFEKCMDTIYNCPVVCNYDRDTDTLGGHDMELVHKDDSYRLVNLTQPVGFVPQGAKIYWKEVEEEDGTVNEYLCTEVLLWKRQEAYQKIKEDGITAQSMEINVLDGERVDGIYTIKDFEFTAFALIGCEPCFESASLVFSAHDFKYQLAEMINDFENSCKKEADTSLEDSNINKKYSMEGGEKVLDKKKLLEKYGVDAESLDFSIEDISYEDLEAKLKEKFGSDSNNEENEPEEEVKTDDVETEDEEGSEGNENFGLVGNTVDSIIDTLSSVTIQTDWNDNCRRYSYVDCDLEAMEVYCWDISDWKLYGFKYEMNGDNVVIDFESKVRKKYVIADYDEGEQKAPFTDIYEEMAQSITEKSEFEEKYLNASTEITSMNKELNSLRSFKAKMECDEVFALFEDLVGIEEYDNLKSECKEDYLKFEVEALKEKCFAIKGKYGVAAQYSMAGKKPKIVVSKEDASPDPYGGIFEEYGITNN